MALSMKDEDGNVDLGAIVESEFQALLHSFIFLCFSLRSLDFIIDQNLETEASRWDKILKRFVPAEKQTDLWHFSITATRFCVMVL